MVNAPAPPRAHRTALARALSAAAPPRAVRLTPVSELGELDYRAGEPPAETAGVGAPRTSGLEPPSSPEMAAEDFNSDRAWARVRRGIRSRPSGWLDDAPGYGVWLGMRREVEQMRGQNAHRQRVLRARLERARRDLERRRYRIDEAHGYGRHGAGG